eukprot:scpid23695/ scgid29890/ PAS domain-containing serine/threonine-protein kinase
MLLDADGLIYLKTYRRHFVKRKSLENLLSRQCSQPNTIMTEKSQGVITNASDSIAALAAQKRATRNSTRAGHERKSSPSYAVHIEHCRKKNQQLHDNLVVKQINFNELAELGSSSQSREDGTVGPSSLPVDDPAVLRIEDAIQSCHLASSDSNTRSRSRTLSKSSRTSVDSLRTQGNHSGLGNKFTASHCGSPLCTSEVYELSHYIDYGSTEASMTVKNPNKMLLTIDMDTSAVLVANSVASAVFGYSRTEFEGLHFEELLHSDNYLGTMSLLEEHCGSDGEQLMVPEQLVIAVDKAGTSFPASLWVKPIKTGKASHCLAIMEQVGRTTAVLTLSMKGDVIDADPELAPIFGFHDNPSDLLDSSICNLLPRLVLPERKTESMAQDLKEQHVTGQLQDGTTLPLTVLMRFSNEKDRVMFQGASFPSKHKVFEIESDIQCVIVLYHNITGLLTVRLDGTISSCDASFCAPLFGYSADELGEKTIDELIPGMMNEVRSAGLQRLRFNTMPYHLSSRMNSTCSTGGRCSHSSSSGPSSAGGQFQTVPNDLGIILEGGSGSGSSPERSEQSDPDEQRSEIFLSQQKSLDATTELCWTRSPTPELMGRSTPGQTGKKRAKHVRGNVTPTARSGERTLNSGDIKSDVGCGADSNSLISSFSEHGSRSSCLAGMSLNTSAIHKDDFSIEVSIHVKHILFNNDTSLLCLWVKRDYGVNEQPSPSTSIRSCVSDTDDSGKDSQPNSSEEAFEGPYTDMYKTLKTVGSGAFGDVKLARHKTTREKVIVKCIGKREVLSCSWTEVTPEQRKQLNIATQQSINSKLENFSNSVPTELYLLRTLDHPNIVNLVDVFENELYYQLVMAKHGRGMDLFEFIDYEPAVDEPLAFHIFSQVVNAIDYLHHKQIIHRDIKDENIIIDQDFRVKLIDFGSAAFMKEGTLFDSFCGTIEYCSPEVLSGNKYRGPELEMWTLGVTLFTLVFFENPFKDADDIINGHLNPPFAVSSRLLRVLLWLLHPDPLSRCTITQLRSCSWMKQQVDMSKYDFDMVLRGQAIALMNNSKTKILGSSQKGNSSNRFCQSR